MLDRDLHHKARIPNGLNMYLCKLPSAITFMFNPFRGCIKICSLPWVSPTAIHIKALWAFQRHQPFSPLLGREKFG